MMELIFRAYSLLHLIAKRIIGHNDNSGNSIFHYTGKQDFAKTEDEAVKSWMNFVESSKIGESRQYSGFHYAGFILEKGCFCLPSWIWTNSSIVRMYATVGNIQEAVKLCNLLMTKQLDCGGWVVRNDYRGRKPVPVMAPNDSAYIANNALLSVYYLTRDAQYLSKAKLCADWIMATARNDGLLYTGYNLDEGKWNKDNIIVDTGFAAGLFVNLSLLTEAPQYKSFLIRFLKRYIELFYDPQLHGFATSIDSQNKKQGGMFSRGQAWALEGLIPAYRLLKSDSLRKVIEDTIDNLIKHQNKDGSWPYNLTRVLMGNDCKGVPVIAMCLYEWYSMTNDQRILSSVIRAYKWCCSHTLIEGPGRGGIFSFDVEGGIVKDMYSSCAFVYASAYAIELSKMIAYGNR